MKDEEYQTQVIERLDVLIRLLLDGLRPSEDSSTASKISRLSSIGLSPTAIAKVIGKPVNYVTATMSQKRRTALRKKKKDDSD